MSQPACGGEDGGVDRVAEERLVASLAHLDDGDAVLLRRSRQMEQRHAHGIRDRLVLVVDELRQAADDVLIVKDDLVVVGLEELRDSAGVRKLVEARLVREGDRERPQRLWGVAST